VAVLDAHARVAVAGPRIVDDGGRAELSYGAMIGPFAECGRSCSRTGTTRPGLIGARVERASRHASFPIGSAAPAC
jgi:hypothetical protein